MNERVMELLQYLDRLSTLNEGGYRCNDEIGECIGWVREELKINEDGCEKCGGNVITIELIDGHGAEAISSECQSCHFTTFNKV